MPGKLYVLIITFCISLVIHGCSKKHHPGRTVETSEKNNNLSISKNKDSLTTKKVVIKSKPEDAIAKVIIVNDNVARKSVDGRLYYDLLGHRYWKNYKDGKYYLFNKSMYTNNAFKKPD